MSIEHGAGCGGSLRGEDSTTRGDSRGNQGDTGYSQQVGRHTFLDTGQGHTELSHK